MTTPSIKTHESASSSSGEFCGICRRQISRYTCPSCNLFYCSLSCFRSEPHSRCSEVFYRKEIEIGIKSGPSKTEEDREKTIELLKRIEDQSAANEDGLFHHFDEESESEENSLTQRLAAVDISSASADDLLRLLTKQERNRFFTALKDPSSGLARELLESTDLDEAKQLPWWEDNGQSPFLARIPYGVKLDFIVVPTNLVNEASGGVSLLYNISAVLLAYAYVTRYLSMSPLSWKKNDSQDQSEARRILSQSVPFLVDHRSKLRYVSLADAVISFWSRHDSGSIDNKTILVLLTDLATLVRPRRVTVAENSSGERETTTALTTDHPFATTVLAISDISSLFNTGADSSAVVRRSCRTAMKLTFYAAHVLATPAAHLHALADEVSLLSNRLGQEAS